MSKKNVESDQLVRLVIYLSPITDQELIDHFEPFIKKHKASAEAKRMIYKSWAVENSKK